MIKKILVIIALLWQPALHAQKKGFAKTDSLLNVLKTTRHDTTRVNTLNTLAAELLQRNKTDSATELSAAALLLSKKINFAAGEANSYYSVGKAYAAKANTTEALKNFGDALKLYEVIGQQSGVADSWYSMGIIHQRSNYDEAVRMFKKSLDAAQRTNNKNLMGRAAYIIATTMLRKGDHNEGLQYNDLAIRYYSESGNETGLANCYVVSARINHRRGNLQQAIKENYSALRLYEQTGNETGVFNVHTGLGLIYEDQKNYTEALNSYQASKKSARELGDKETISNASNNIGNVYREMGETGEALKAFQESLRLAEEVGSKKAIANAQGNLGTIYSRMGKPTEALQSYEQAIKLFEQLGAREAIGIAYFEIAQVYFNLIKPEESKLSLEKALQVGRQVQNKDVISKSYRLLSQIDSSAADYVSALEHYKLYITYRDSISNAEAAKNLIEQRMEYSFSKKEDSLRLQQALIAEQLDKQTLLTKQQQQELRLKQASLELARREKDVQMLSFLKTQAELQLSNEQKEKELTLAEQQRALQQAQLEKQTLLSTQKEQSLLLKDKELSAQRSQRNFWIGGAIALFLLSFFIFLNYRNQRNANSRLQHQQARTERALTELKSAQAQLIQSEKMASLGELTAGIAHEIQNPLNFVNNFADLNDEMVDEMNHELLSGKFDDAVALGKVIKENNSKINHHGKRADAIVKGMLQHSRPASTMKEPTDINKLADEYLRLSYHGLRAKDKDFYANLASDFDEHIGNIEIVPQDIGRVLLNLYNNAFYAVNEKKKQMDGRFEPTVSVTIKNSGAKVEISVRDNGTGIPQKALDKIYHPFFTTKPTGQGTGLGLSLSYDIIKAHGGELNVETKEGEFSEFIVRLPVRNKNSNLI